MRTPCSIIAKRFVFTLGIIAGSSVAAAAVPLVNIDPLTQIVPGSPGPGTYHGFNEGHGNGMVGWTFTLNTPVTLTQVGWYDDGQDGLSRAFQVGLWRNPMTPTPTALLGASGVTIPGGTTATLSGAWRVVNLTSPLNLSPGEYVLAGLDSSTTPDVIKYVDGGPSSAQVTIGQWTTGYLPPQTPGFHAPTVYGLNPGLELGPMVFTNVPEPVTGVLFALGAMGMRRRVKRSC